MADATERFEWVCKLARICLIGIIALLTLVVIAMVATIVKKLPDMVDWTELVCLLGSLVCLLLSFVLYGLVGVVISSESCANTAAGRLGQIEALLTGQSQSIKKLVELASLSDRAKSLVFRDCEIDALREAVHHDMMKQDYKSAEALISSLEAQLGYVDEAARLREELESSRKSTLDEKIDAAVKRIQDIISGRDWSRAIRESNRVMRLFPNNPKIAALPGRIESARAKHKRSVLQEYGEAVRKKDIDRSIELLQELDLYLTPQEAAALADSARGVFKARLHNLGVQFAIRVTDNEWAKAVEVGEEIIREYPNSRMAHEVRQKMDLLSTRALAAKEKPTGNNE